MTSSKSEKSVAASPYSWGTLSNRMDFRPGEYLRGVMSVTPMSRKSKESGKKTSNEKPNIVFLFTDDQTYTSIHALGNNEIITPNLDRLKS